MEIMRISFEAGEFRFFDWINEQRRTLEIQKDLFLTAKDYFLAAAELEYLTGSALKQRRIYEYTIQTSIFLHSSWF